MASWWPFVMEDAFVLNFVWCSWNRVHAGRIAKKNLGVWWAIMIVCIQKCKNDFLHIKVINQSVWQGWIFLKMWNKTQWNYCIQTHLLSVMIFPKVLAPMQNWRRNSWCEGRERWPQNYKKRLANRRQRNKSHRTQSLSMTSNFACIYFQSSCASRPQDWILVSLG